MLRPFAIRWHALDLGDPDAGPGRPSTEPSGVPASPRSQKDFQMLGQQQSAIPLQGSSAAATSRAAAPDRRPCAGLFGERLDQRSGAGDPLAVRRHKAALQASYSLALAARLIATG